MMIHNQDAQSVNKYQICLQFAHSQVLARKRATETRPPPCLDRISSSLIVRGPSPCPFINSRFRHAVRCSCSSVPDGQTWSIPTECVNLSSLSTSVAGAKSLQMPHRFPLFSASHFSASFFFPPPSSSCLLSLPRHPRLYYYYLPRAGTVWKRPVCAAARHTAL